MTLTAGLTRTALLLATGIFLGATRADAVTIGLTDTFNGGLQNWTTSLGPGGGVPPVGPTRISSGGPGGAGDAYMALTAIGGCDRPGCRLVAMNPAQWAGDYLAAGVTRIDMDLINLGSTALTIRLLFEDPLLAPPADEAVTTFGALLPVGSGWTHVGFDVSPAALTTLLGSNTTLMSNVTIMRIIHAPAAGEPVSVVGSVGVDNIRAVPEPLTILLGATALAGIAARRVRRRSAIRH